MIAVKVAAVCILAAAIATAQDRGVRVRAIRVLANDPEAIATFYEKAFGMSEIHRTLMQMQDGTLSVGFIEIVINSGVTVDAGKTATTTPIVIATRSANSPAAAMASLILQAPDLDKAIGSVKANGGTVMPPSGEMDGLKYAFVKDPDGNQIELVMTPK